MNLSIDRHEDYGICEKRQRIVALRRILKHSLFVAIFGVLLFMALVAYGYVMYTDVSCRPVGPSETYCARDQETQFEISVAEAAERGFPIYLPASDLAQAQGIVITPTITIKSFDETCSYLTMEFVYKKDDSTFATMHVSNGCAMPLGGLGYAEVPLNWARYGKARELTQSEIPVLGLTEEKKGFLYVVFPAASEPTLQFLESMEYYEP